MKTIVRGFTLVASLTLLALLAARVDAGSLTEDTKLLASYGTPFQAFGRSVSISGDVALVGAPAGEGAAYVYRFDGSTWIEEQKLTGSDGGVMAFFGSSVSLDGSVALVGAWGDEENGTLSGAAYVYRFDGSTWIEEQKLTASDGVVSDQFGGSVSVQGNTALIGALGNDDNGPSSGSAYVFRFDGSTWAEEQRLIASDSTDGDRFGSTVSLDGDAAVIGSVTGDVAGVDSGSAYVYRFDGATWNAEQKLAPLDGAAGDAFGFRVAIDGDTVVVAAPADDGDAVDRGASYVFRFDGSSWVEAQKLTASDEDEDARFGQGVAIRDGTLLVGASGADAARGAAYVFREVASTWTEVQKLVASDGSAGDALGSAVSVDGFLLVGAAADGDLGTEAGSAYLFYRAACSVGTVNDGAGEITDVLYLNGSSGGPERTVAIGADDLMVVTIVRPPAGGNGRFVLHGVDGLPDRGSEHVLPFALGDACFPFFLPESPAVLVANNVGKTQLVGESHAFGEPTEDPERATTSFAYFGPFPIGMELTFQAIILDPGSTSPKSASLTNAVFLTIDS